MGRKKVLQDHQRVGKDLIPPFTHKLGKMNHVSWDTTILPEILWIPLLIMESGLKEGVELSRNLSKFANESLNDEERIFGSISSFKVLNEKQQEIVKNKLVEKETLPNYQKALSVLVKFYPECHLSFLFDTCGNNLDSKHDLEYLKNLLQKLFDKRSKLAVNSGAAFISIAFDSGRLKVHEGSSLTNLNSLANYPKDKESKMVASSIASSLNFFFGSNTELSEGKWSIYFWNRGLELEKCKIYSP